MARIVLQTFGLAIDKNVVYRVLSKHDRPAPGGTGPSCLAFIGHTADSCRPQIIGGALGSIHATRPSPCA
jgi:hypothetical protein